MKNVTYIEARSDTLLLSSTMGLTLSSCIWSWISIFPEIIEVAAVVYNTIADSR